jgi:hypothetical protein
MQNGGYVRFVINDGNPHALEDGVQYFANTRQDREARQREFNRRLNTVMNVVRNDSLRATSTENDLLQSLFVSQRLLGELDDAARRANRRIGARQVIILDTGIVTAGLLDFTANGIDKEPFRFRTDAQHAEFANNLAERLYTARQLPDLNQASVVFIGLGDVAYPQPRLCLRTRAGLVSIWRAILSRSNISGEVDIKDYEGDRRNPNREGFPRIRPIIFSEVENIRVLFDTGVWDVYSDSIGALGDLRRAAPGLISSLTSNPGAKLYLVGSESKERDRPYTPCLSHGRATTVMKTLEELGVPRQSMEAFGLAVYLPGRTSDFIGGVFNQRAGAENRKVMVIPSDMINREFHDRVIAVRDSLYATHRRSNPNCRICFN